MRGTFAILLQHNFVPSECELKLLSLNTMVAFFWGGFPKNFRSCRLFPPYIWVIS